MFICIRIAMTKRKEVLNMADEIKTTPSSEETNPDWYEEGYPALQGELEFINEGDVTIPTSRYDELLRAEHTAELIRKAYTNKAFKYDS